MTVSLNAPQHKHYQCLWAIYDTRLPFSCRANCTRLLFARRDIFATGAAQPIHLSVRVSVLCSAEKQTSGEKTSSVSTGVTNAKDLTCNQVPGSAVAVSEAGGDSEDRDRQSQPHPPMEHVVKSPPEPTRVKSPEQIMMRSPDPVNWTVPLDTGKTFTVTQNVREGE